MIDINNEEEILLKCDFNFYLNLKKCSFEFCMFYNDILHCKNPNFNKRQAFIDLGRIAIELNKKE